MSVYVLVLCALAGTSQHAPRWPTSTSPGASFRCSTTFVPICAAISASRSPGALRCRAPRPLACPHKNRRNLGSRRVDPLLVPPHMCVPQDLDADGSRAPFWRASRCRARRRRRRARLAVRRSRVRFRTCHGGVAVGARPVYAMATSHAEAARSVPAVCAHARTMPCGTPRAARRCRCGRRRSRVDQIRLAVRVPRRCPAHHTTFVTCKYRCECVLRCSTLSGHATLSLGTSSPPCARAGRFHHENYIPTVHRRR